MSILSRIGIISLIMILLTACGSPTAPKKIPDKLTGTGIVIGRLAANYLPLDKPLSLELIDANNNRYTIEVATSGHFVQSLPAGSYTLTKIQIKQKRLLIQTRFTLARFTLSKGTVSNLGLLVIQPLKQTVNKDQPIPATVYSINNSRQIRVFLAKKHPQLNRSLSKWSFRYRRSHRISRMTLTEFQQWHISQWQNNIPRKRPSRVFKTGFNGINGWVSYAKNGKILKADFIPTKTYDTIKCAAIGDKAVCLHPNKTMSYYLGNRHYKVRKLTLSLKPIEIKTFGSRGIAVYDGRKTLAFSQNWGKSWQKQILPVSAVKQPPRTGRLSIHSTSNGYFAALKNEQFLLHLLPGRTQFKLIKLPASINHINFLSFQLLIGPIKNSDKPSTKILAIKYKTLKQKSYHFADSQCRQIEFDYSTDPLKLTMECKNALYQSHNKGLSWVPLRFRQSQNKLK